MARQRLIRPDFFTDERLAVCPPHARLLFAGLWGLADKRGRLRDQPPVIHGAVFPFEPDLGIDSLLDDLQDAGSILRYAVEGKKYIQVKNFERYQKPHPKEAESVIPAPPPLYRAEPRKEIAEPLLFTAEPGGICSSVPNTTPSDTTPSGNEQPSPDLSLDRERDRRADVSNPRAQGTNPRALGTNPRAFRADQAAQLAEAEAYASSIGLQLTRQERRHLREAVRALPWSEVRRGLDQAASDEAARLGLQDLRHRAREPAAVTP